MKKIYSFLTLFLIGISVFSQSMYHRLGKLGVDRTSATNNFCQNKTIGKLKLNITNITSPYSIGSTIWVGSVNDSFKGYYIV